MLPQDKDELGEQLSAYVDGELNAVEAAEVERMIAADPQAAALLETLRRTVETVRALPRRPAPDGMLDDLTSRIERAQLLGGSSEKARAVRGDRRSAWRLLASAAIVIFAVGGGFWAFNRMSESISGPEEQFALGERKTPSATPWGKAADTERMGARRRGGKGTHPPKDQLPKTEPDEAVDADSGPKLDVTFRTQIEHKEIPSPAEEAAVSADVGERGVGRGRTAAEPEPVMDGFGEKAASTERRTIAIPMRPAPAYGPHDSLEAKLCNGVKRSEVLMHPFTNEANQLYVSFPDAQDREEAQNRMIAFMAANNIPVLQKTVVHDADPVPPSLEFALVGHAHANFPETSRDRQVLVRLPPPELDALMDEVGIAAGRHWQLNLGSSVVASTRDQVRAVLGSSSAGRIGRHAARAEERLAMVPGSAANIEARRGKRVAGAASPKALRKTADVGPAYAAEGAEPGRDREPTVRKPVSRRRGAPRAPSNTVGPADTSTDGLREQPDRAALPALETREGATGQPDAAEDIITVVINLGVLPDEGQGVEPVPPRSTRPTTTQRGAASELPENP